MSKDNTAVRVDNKTEEVLAKLSAEYGLRRTEAIRYGVCLLHDHLKDMIYNELLRLEEVTKG